MCISKKVYLKVPQSIIFAFNCNTMIPSLKTILLHLSSTTAAHCSSFFFSPPVDSYRSSPLQQQQVGVQSFARRSMSPLPEKGQHLHPFPVIVFITFMSRLDIRSSSFIFIYIKIVLGT